MKIKELNKKIEETKEESICKLCRDSGIVQSPGNKYSHTCWKCLKEGKLNQ